MRDRSVVRLSVTPSTKYSCEGSPPIFANGRTTMDKCGALGELVVVLPFLVAGVRPSQTTP